MYNACSSAPKLLMKLKFIYSEKAAKFCEISTVDWTGTKKEKSTVEILQNFVAFSEYMNFTELLCKVLRQEGLRAYCPNIYTVPPRHPMPDNLGTILGRYVLYRRMLSL